VHHAPLAMAFGLLLSGVPTDPTPAKLAALMEPYARHVLICTGGYCSPNREGRLLYAQLARLLQREALLFGPRRVKRGETPCLGVCAGGPIVVVYPEGIWYAGVTPELLERIVVEHLRDGRVVEEAVFHRLR
jgi:(2Fe-2S) ferredoxin